MLGRIKLFPIVLCFALVACAAEETGGPSTKGPSAPAGRKGTPPGFLSAEGLGTFTSVDASLEVKKQEAFISAIVDGVRNLAVRLEEPSITFPKTAPGRIVSSAKGTIGDFEIEDEIIVSNARAEGSAVICRYRGQKIIVIDAQLLFPPDVGMLEFPNWKTPPETISGMTIEKVVWEDDVMEVKLILKLPDDAG